MNIFQNTSRTTQCQLIDLELTRRYQANLNKLWDTQFDQIVKLLESAEHNLRQESVFYDTVNPLRIKLTSFVVSQNDYDYLQQLAEGLHLIIEKAIDWTLQVGNEVFEELFCEYERIRPYFRKEALADYWQRYARYDAIIDDSGLVKFIELNTCSPAGFVLSPASANQVNHILIELNLLGEMKSGTVCTGDMLKLMLDIREDSIYPHAAVALLYDENKITNELENFRLFLEEKGLPVVVGDMADCRYRNQQLWLGDIPISTCYCKIRIANAENRGYCWALDFKEKYADFLMAVQNQHVSCVNNLCVATVSEDKSMLQVLHHPDFQKNLLPEEIAMINKHVAWTAALNGRKSFLNGELVDTWAFVRDNKDSLLLKPSNQSRGKNIIVGKLISQSEWEKHCQPEARMPFVAQEYIEPFDLRVRVYKQGTENTETVRHYQTIALGMIDGKFKGIISRVAPLMVSSVANTGVTQSVLVK